MNYKSVIFTIILCIGFSCAQDNIKPPQVILNAFQKLYPNVEDVEWEKEGGNYEAEFTLNGDQMSVEFNADGKVLETEIEGQNDMDNEGEDQGKEANDNDENDQED